MVTTRDDVLGTIRRFNRTRTGQFGLVRIGVFGSAARDKLASDSDVDVVVELAQPDLLLMVGIKQELETLLERPVDIVRYRQNMNPLLKEHIDREAVYA